MVQGLGFLSKKSWHTKNLANQEKVWMAEQRKEAEASKTKELAKQIQREREQEELDRISGKKTVMDRGIDWMYQGGTTGDLAREDAAKKAEEYLLGKEYVGPGGHKGDFADCTSEGINKILESKPAAAAPNGEESSVGNPLVAADADSSVKDRNESFRLRLEDPMFLVNQKQRERVMKSEQNRALYEKVMGSSSQPGLEGNEDRWKDRRRDTKKRKRDRKREEEKKRSRRGGERRDRSRSRSRSKESSRKRSRRRYGSSPSSSPERGYDDRRRRNDRSRHRDDEAGRSFRHGRSSDRHERRLDAGYRSRTQRNSSDEEHDRHGGVQKVGHFLQKHGHGGRADGRPARDINPVELAGYHQQSQGNGTRDGYGLRGGVVGTLNLDDLGPNEELLRRKRDEQDEEKRRVREIASTRRRVSAQDRANAVKEMQFDAKLRDVAISRKASRSTNDEENTPTRARATFLQDMSKRTHGISNSVPSLSSSIAQNRNTNQRLHDSFL